MKKIFFPSALISVSQQVNCLNLTLKMFLHWSTELLMKRLMSQLHTADYVGGHELFLGWMSGLLVYIFVI